MPTITTSPDMDQLVRTMLIEASTDAEFLKMIQGNPSELDSLPSPEALNRYSSERMRSNLYITLKEQGLGITNGLAINRAWADIYLALAKRGISDSPANGLVRGYPHTVVRYDNADGLVLRKWCKTQEAVSSIAERGYLSAAHSGFNVYNEYLVPDPHFPDLTGVMLLHRTADPKQFGFHDYCHHYIDVMFTGAAVLYFSPSDSDLHKQYGLEGPPLPPQKYLLPLPARIRHAEFDAYTSRKPQVRRLIERGIYTDPIIPLPFTKIVGSSIGDFVKAPAPENNSPSQPPPSQPHLNAPSASAAAFMNSGLYLTSHKVAPVCPVTPAFILAHA